MPTPLFIRTAAEIGLFGLIVLIGFLVICSRVRGDQHIDIRNALMPYIIVRMGRLGAWFSLELISLSACSCSTIMHSRASYGGRMRPAPRSQPEPT